jgi:hypothetical protein
VIGVQPMVSPEPENKLAIASAGAAQFNQRGVVAIQFALQTGLPSGDLSSAPDAI